MGTAQLIVSSIIGLSIAGTSVAYWAWVMRVGQARFRALVERRYQVTIGFGSRGHWKVTSGPGSAFKHFGIELLQLAHLMGAMLVWGLGMGLAVGALFLVDRLWRS